MTSGKPSWKSVWISTEIHTINHIHTYKKQGNDLSHSLAILCNSVDYLLSAVATSTAQATVQPTIRLLPIPRNPIISTCAETDDNPRAEQIHLFCRGAKEEKPVGLNWWRTCELCVRVHTTHSVGHSLRSEYQHLHHGVLKPCKPLIYIRIITPS